MKKWLKRIYNNLTLTAKIRFSYSILLIPIVLFLVFCFYNLWSNNRNYEDMINSAVVASEFSLDFKKDFDYETYLLLVENKSVEESSLDEMLSEANQIVDRLDKLTDSSINTNHLRSVKKYMSSLETYKKRIEENLLEGNKYEDNIEIWENDIQIVTSLVQDTISQYIFYEIRDIQLSRTEYQEFFKDMITFSIIIFVVILVIIIFLSYYIPLSITRPIRTLSEVTEQVANGNLSVRAQVHSGVEIKMLSDSLNTMIDKINELLNQVMEEQIQLRKAEFELLQSQINPHFLYNTLDAIIWLAESGEQKKVIDMVVSLSEFFRTSLNRGEDMVTIKKELQHVRSYLEIQQMRYQDILQYEIKIPKDLHEYMIPKITIQPLVENALYHGIKNKRGFGQIVISGKREKDYFIIQVEDNGIGITKERLMQVKDGIRDKILTGKDMYGLYNVNERIRLNFGEEYGISIESTYGVSTIVSLKLPYKDEKNKE